MATHRDLFNHPELHNSNAVFDESGNFLLYASLVGIKTVNLLTNKVECILGRVENTERFLQLALLQGSTSKKSAIRLTQPELTPTELDPIVVSSAYKKERFFIFSRREPEEAEGAVAHGRDVFNEPLTREQILAAEAESLTSVNLPRSAVIHTSKVRSHF